MMATAQPTVSAHYQGRPIRVKPMATRNVRLSGDPRVAQESAGTGRRAIPV